MRRLLTGIALLAAWIAPAVARAADEGPWHAVPSQTAVQPEKMYPNSVFLALGFHYFPAMQLTAGATSSPPGAHRTRDDFVRALYHNFRSQFVAGTSFELGYGYRFHRHFGLQVQGAFLTQRTEIKANVFHQPANLAYQYVGGLVVALAQARFPVSKLDFVIGLGPQVSMADVLFYLRGSTAETDENNVITYAKGFRIKDEDPFMVGVGGVVEGGMEYRPRDNWGITIDYRFAMVPSRFRGHAFDQGGHYGLLMSYFHF